MFDDLLKATLCPSSPEPSEDFVLCLLALRFYAVAHSPNIWSVPRNLEPMIAKITDDITSNRRVLDSSGRRTGRSKRRVFFSCPQELRQLLLPDLYKQIDVPRIGSANSGSLSLLANKAEADKVRSRVRWNLDPEEDDFKSANEADDMLVAWDTVDEDSSSTARGGGGLWSLVLRLSDEAVRMVMAHPDTVRRACLLADGMMAPLFGYEVRVLRATSGVPITVRMSDDRERSV